MYDCISIIGKFIIGTLKCPLCIASFNQSILHDGFHFTSLEIPLVLTTSVKSFMAFTCSLHSVYIVPLSNKACGRNARHPIQTKSSTNVRSISNAAIMVN